jgi:hypothetical protein
MRFDFEHEKKDEEVRRAVSISTFDYRSQSIHIKQE